MCLLVLERKGKRATNIDVREKHQSVASHTPTDQGLNLQPKAGALTGDATHNFLVYGRTLQTTEPPARV